MKIWLQEVGPLKQFQLLESEFQSRRIFHHPKNIIQQKMSSPISQLFLLLTNNHNDVLAESCSLALKDTFEVLLQPGFPESVVLGLTQNFLLISYTHEGLETNYFSPLNFDIKFQVLRRQWPDAKTPGLPYGIRIERQTTNLCVQFFSSNPDIVSEWGFALSRKINQRNFHQLFRAKKKIGKGAFASVYLAERLMDKKMVAVKAFSKQKQFSGDKGKESLENQIRIMRSVDHPNITKLEEVYETENSIYVILECLTGKQLNEQIKRGRKFGLEEVKTIIKQILSALQHLSKKRIIHRDLKPENIMFKRDVGLQVSICDFGLATKADQEKYLFVRCGTPGFVAPEIINIKDMQTKSEPISDVFSAGVIMHLLMLGFSIFPGKKYNEVLNQNRNCEFNFTRHEYLTLSPIAMDLLVRMLERNPKRRISAHQALQHHFFSSNSQMETEEEERKPLKEIKILKLTHKKRYDLGYNSEMVDENDEHRHSQGSSTVKKKMPHYGYQSLMHSAESRFHKRYM